MSVDPRLHTNAPPARERASPIRLLKNGVCRGASSLCRDSEGVPQLQSPRQGRGVQRAWGMCPRNKKPLGANKASPFLRWFLTAFGRVERTVES